MSPTSGSGMLPPLIEQLVSLLPFFLEAKVFGDQVVHHEDPTGTNTNDLDDFFFRIICNEIVPGEPST